MTGVAGIVGALSARDKSATVEDTVFVNIREILRQSQVWDQEDDEGDDEG